MMALLKCCDVLMLPIVSVFPETVAVPNVSRFSIRISGELLLVQPKKGLAGKAAGKAPSASLDPEATCATEPAGKTTLIVLLAHPDAGLRKMHMSIVRSAAAEPVALPQTTTPTSASVRCQSYGSGHGSLDMS